MQSSVAAVMGFGVVGEAFLDRMSRVQPGILDTATAANNVFGRAFTVSAGADGTPGSAITVEAGGTGNFAGILVNPKNHASYGTSAGGPLAASLTLPNNVVAEFCKDADGIIVTFADEEANEGDWVEFAQATGVLSPLAPMAAATVGSTIIDGARVERYDVTSGLAVISLTANVAPYTAPAAP